MNKFAVAIWLQLLAFSAVGALEEPLCTDKYIADVLFIDDGSNSINSVGWGRSLNCTAYISRELHRSSNDVRFAFATFSTTFQIVSTFADYRSQTEFENAVYGTKQLKENTRTYNALNEIRTRGVFKPEMGGRENVPKVLVITTDAKSNNMSKTATAAEALRKEGVIIICLLVGVPNQVEAAAITGDDKNIFSVKSFAALETIFTYVIKRVCEAPGNPPPPPCNKTQDLVFVVDSSGSVGPQNYPKNFIFIALVVSNLDIGENATRVALVIYGTHAYTIFPLTGSKEEIMKNIENVPYRNSSTQTDAGLRRAKDLCKPENGGRDIDAKTVVLITDGLSTQPDQTIIAVNELKDDGFNIMCAGIKPDANQEELNAVATKPEWVFSVDSYADLVATYLNVTEASCKAKPPPKPVHPCPPTKKVDTYILCDSSGSIGLERYEMVKRYLYKVMQAFNFGENAIKIALCTYGTHVRKQLGLTGNKTEILEKIPQIPYQNSTTNTHLALEWVSNSGVSSPEQGARSDAKQFVFLITDGESDNKTETQKAGQELKDNGFLMFVVAIGNAVNNAEITGLASKPEYILTPADFTDLDYFASQTSDGICYSES